MRLDEVFDSRYGHSLEQVYLDRADGDNGVNFVSRTGRNNGVSGRVMIPEEVVPGFVGEITVALGSSSVLSTFVQDELFVCGYHVCILTPKVKMRLAEKLWWCAAIRANAFKYSYGRQANRTLGALELPDECPAEIRAMGDDLPDVFGEVWEFTSEVVRDLPALREWDALGIEDRFPISVAVDQPVQLRDSSTWGSFLLSDLFEVKSGNPVTMKMIESGATPVVSSSMLNNGVVMMGDVEPEFKGHTLSLAKDGSVGFVAYQAHPWFGTGHAMALLPKSHITSEAMIFVAGLLRFGLMPIHGYGRALRSTTVGSVQIKLPVTPAGEPDWEYIEAYVQGVSVEFLADIRNRLGAQPSH